MKNTLLCVVVTVVAFGRLHAQSNLEARIVGSMLPAPQQFGTVSDADKRIAIQRVAELLRRHVTFRNDGTESAYYDSPHGRQHAEWQNLRIKMLVPMPLSEADKTKGITKRVQALLAYDNCRLLDAKTNSWGAWSLKGHPLFPPAIIIEWNGSKPELNGGMHLANFKPGPLTSPATAVLQPEPAAAPATAAASASSPTNPGVRTAPTQGTMIRTSNGGLPPGMQRAR